MRAEKLLRYLAWGAFIAGCAVLASVVLKNRHRWTKVDFVEYYDWSLELRLGGDPWVPSGDPSFTPVRGLFHRGNCNYTPAFLTAFGPLTTLARKPAYWVWQTTLIGSLFASILILVGELRPPPGPAWYALAIGAVLLFPEVYGAQYESQPTFLLLLLIVSSWALDRRSSSVAAGLALAAATLLKIYPGLVAGYFLLRRRWRTLGWSIVFALAGLIASNPRYEYEFFHFGAPIFERNSWLTWWLKLDRAIGILGNVRAAMDRLWGGTIPPQAQAHWLAISALLALLVLGATATATVEARGVEALEVTILGLWLVAALLISPLGWGHELPLLIPLWLGEAACLLRGAPWKTAGAALTAFGLVGIVAAYFWSPLRHAHLFFVATIITFIGGWWLVRSWSVWYRLLGHLEAVEKILPAMFEP